MGDKSVAIKGGIWTSMSTAITMAAQLLRIMLLTRFLVSKDFGVVSIVNMVIGLSLTFTDLGFASVIMYKSDLNKREFSSLFWLQFLLFVLIFGVLCLFSPLVSDFYDEPLLTNLIPIASVSIIGQAIGKLYDSVLLKRYYFKSLALRNIITNVFSLLLAWLLAYNGYGVFSLIFSTLFQVFSYNIWNFIVGYKLQPIGLFFKVKEVKPLLKVGIFQTGVHIMDYISGSLDVMIIGKILGTELLGFYDLAKQLVIKFISLIRTVVSKVALPILSNSRTDEEVVNKFLLITKTVAIICTPICTIIALFNHEFVRVIYGTGYEPVAPLVAIFACYTIFSSITSFIDMLGITKGRTDLNFYGTVIRVVVSSLCVYLASHISIAAVAWSQSVILFITFTVSWIIIVRRYFHLSFLQYFRQMDKLLFIMLLAYGGASALRHFLLNTMDINMYSNIVFTVSVFIIISFVGAGTLLKKDISLFLSMIKKKA